MTESNVNQTQVNELDLLIQVFKEHYSRDPYSLKTITTNIVFDQLSNFYENKYNKLKYEYAAHNECFHFTLTQFLNCSKTTNAEVVDFLLKFKEFLGEV